MLNNCAASSTIAIRAMQRRNRWRLVVERLELRSHNNISNDKTPTIAFLPRPTQAASYFSVPSRKKNSSCVRYTNGTNGLRLANSARLNSICKMQEKINQSRKF